MVRRSERDAPKPTKVGKGKNGKPVPSVLTQVPKPPPFGEPDPLRPDPFKVGDRVTVGTQVRIYVITELVQGLATLDDGTLVGVTQLHHAEATAPQTHLGAELRGLRKPALKPEPVRTAAWKWRSDDKCFGILRIRNGDDVACYFVRLLQSRGLVLLTKLEVDRTTDYVCSITPAVHCGCEGYKRHGSCKHIDALQSLKQRKEL